MFLVLVFGVFLYLLSLVVIKEFVLGEFGGNSEFLEVRIFCGIVDKVGDLILER